MVLTTDILSSVFSLLGGSSKAPSATEQVESIHTQLRAWQNGNPPTLRRNLQSVLCKYVAEEIRPISDMHYEKSNDFSNLYPVSLNYGDIRASLEPSKGDGLTDEDHQAKWHRLVKHETDFTQAVDTYKALQGSQPLSISFTARDILAERFYHQIEKEPLMDWHRSLVSLAEVYTNQGAAEKVEKGED